MTEVDWRLFTTLVRFDAVCHGHFKTIRRRIEDYPNRSNHVRNLYRTPGVAETVSLRRIRQHYYVSQRTINPTQIAPKGAEPDVSRALDRGGFAFRVAV